MTKTKRFITTFLALILSLSVLLCATPGAMANDEEDVLLIEDVVQINDTQIAVVFSEPVVFNLYGDNRGPWIDFRIVDAANGIQVDENGSYLQWQGVVQFANQNHDVVLITFGDKEISLADFSALTGVFAPYAGRGWFPRVSIEEVPFKESEPSHDGFVENITTLDGSKMLWATRMGGWDGSLFDIRVDYNYVIEDLSPEPVKAVDNFDYGTIMSVGTGVNVAIADVEASAPVMEVKNNPLNYALILGGGVLVAVLLASVLTFAIGKAGKKR